MTLEPYRITQFGLHEGDVIAERHELAGLLGSGVETVVFRARDLWSGDEIAVKVYRATALQNPAALKVFKRQLAVLRDGGHPNVVRILDFGEIADTLYIAMELAYGQPLSLEAGKTWSHADAIEILEQLTDALAWLHSRGVVHGEIRTTNIFWNRGTLKLMDFGLERNSRRVLTPSADLYSAASVIYHLLVGEQPHVILFKGALPEAPPLRARVPDVPDEFTRILERCLDPDPSQRPASAAEVLEECRRLRRNVRARRPGLLLADRISEQALDPNEMTTLLLTICRVLRAIHDAGLAHPDLAPRNIRLVCSGQVEIHTFPPPPPNVTPMISEPKYTAPEMLLTHGADGAAHLQSDIYMLGFASYEALAGRDAFQKQLFENSREPETDLFWMKWHADSAMRLQPLSDVNPSVPQELSALIQRMIEKEPSARPCSLEEVESTLRQVQRRFQPTEDIELGSLSDPVPPDTKPRKRKLKVLLRVVLAVALACGGAVWWSQSDHRSSRLTADALRWAEQNATRVRAFVGELLPALTRTSGMSSPSAPAVIIETKTGPMVLVAAGTFVMGSSAVANEAPARTIHLPAFYIDKYEVSNGRYRSFADSTGYPQPAAPSWDPEYFGKTSHPVLNVSWRDAQAFCSAAGKRLPTEAEWEKAARGAAPASRLWANWTVHGLANLKGAGLAAPAPIGTFAGDVSPFGAYDMAGNVHEWVSNDYHLYDGNPASLDQADATKVVRGGSFALAQPELSPSWRASLNASIALGQDSPVGFRCAADPPRR